MKTITLKTVKIIDPKTNEEITEKTVSFPDDIKWIMGIPEDFWNNKSEKDERIYMTAFLASDYSEDWWKNQEYEVYEIGDFVVLKIYHVLENKEMPLQTMNELNNSIDFNDTYIYKTDNEFRLIEMYHPLAFRDIDNIDVDVVYCQCLDNEYTPNYDIRPKYWLPIYAFDTSNKNNKSNIKTRYFKNWKKGQLWWQNLIERNLAEIGVVEYEPDQRIDLNLPHELYMENIKPLGTLKPDNIHEYIYAINEIHELL